MRKIIFTSLHLYVFTLLSILQCGVGGRLFACGPYDRAYLARDYFLFRACGDNMSGVVSPASTVEANCQAWANVTSRYLSQTDIQQVVYKWDIGKIRNLRASLNRENAEPSSDNELEKWIISSKSTETLDFRILAKRCEMVREKMNDPWYYGWEGDEENQELSSIIKEASAYTGTKLRDRYGLQIMRAQFSMRHYQNCIDTFRKYESSFRNDVIKRMAIGYLAGAYFHLDDKARAKELFLQIDDVYQAVTCDESADLKSRLGMLEALYDAAPDSEYPLLKMQNIIHEIERWYFWYDNGDSEYCTDEFSLFYPFVLRVLKEHRCSDLTPWYYTAAFLADRLGKQSDAQRYIHKAMASDTKGDLRDAIRVLNTFLTMKYADRYSPQLEVTMLRELQWLDDKMENCLDTKTKTQIAEDGLRNHNEGISQYYWSDVMRKIVIGYLTPLCLRSGYTTRALQYLAYADYRIFGLIDDPKQQELFQHYVYSFDYFINLDSVDVKYVKRLAKHINHPSGTVDSFLAARSYADPQFLNEIIGTQLIASMRYSEAIPYLRKLTTKFNKSRNIYSYCRFDPITRKKFKRPDSAYKLHFAEAMAGLEDDISNAENPNDRAELMLRYARALQNSVGELCWPLTMYSWGNFDRYGYYNNYVRSNVEAITRRADQMKQQAFRLFTNDERAARAYYDWKMFRTAATNYPGTTTAKYIHGHCDKLIDYALRPEPHPVVQYEEWKRQHKSDF